MLLFGRKSRELAVNEVFYSRFKFKFSFLFRSVSTWVCLFQLGVPFGSHFAESRITLTGAIGSKIYRFHLMYLSKERMNLNGTKLLVDFRADIAIRYNFNQVR